jgi:DNA helicase II / ATP-dependent DNA helicase PcrA
MLREFVESRRTPTSIPAGGWKVSFHGTDLRVSPEQLASEIDGTRRMPLEVQRRQVIEGLARDLAKTYGGRAGSGPDSESVRRVLNAQIVRALGASWNPIAFPEGYYELLASRSMLRAVAGPVLTQEEIADLLTTPALRKKTLLPEDVPALHYLYGLLYGLPKVSYDHVMIDEAQDLAPMQLKVISGHVPKHSMTVVGDINQAIYANRGIRSWTEFEEAVGDVPCERIEITRNYRSTFEITTFANRMLMASAGSGATPAQPFDRHGPGPTLIRAGSADEMASQVMDLCEGARQDGFRTIAIVCKTLKQCKELARRLKERQIPDAEVVEGDDATLEQGLMLIPVYLTKGLEFDVVILTHADRKSYSDSPEDARVLYVGLTRALHQLHIVWAGKITPLLAGIEDAG